MKQFLALVAVENVAYHFDILYSYIIPEDLSEDVFIGSRVLVPFGRGSNSKRQGIVFSIKQATDTKGLKKILYSLDETPVVTDEMLNIALFLKDRTFCTFFDAVKVQMPLGFNFKTCEKYFAVRCSRIEKLSDEELKIYEYMLTLDEFADKKQIYSATGIDMSSNLLDKLVSKKFVVKTYIAERTVNESSVKKLRLCISVSEIEKAGFKLTSKQKSVIEYLVENGSASVKDICYFTGVTVAVINALTKKGITEIVNEAVYRIPEIYLQSAEAKKEIILNSEQQQAYLNLAEKFKNGGGVSLLYGVTGSGKTSVFLKLIDYVIENGRQVIVMVPEISLTPQMMSIFKGRYGEGVAIFHSALSAGERRDEYKRVKDGKANIVVGTRSAVFAPFDNIGLIVIDEEQEHTYKSESSPRYHTKDVALFRAGKHKSLLLLSSATPSIESYTNAKKGKYGFEVLSKRYGEAVLPEVSVVDMKDERRRGNKYNLSSQILERIEKNIADNKQTILLINRRGYNTFVACDSCGSVVTCPSCSISLTYHSANNRLMCHYCGYSVEMSKICPECGKSDVRYAGYGTQRIEEEIRTLLPESRILRLDTDTTSSRHAFEKALVDFGSGDYDIMLGTQMVAKGLNFENVTLVGVINADQQLNNDDYRSQERTFDLLTQVVGRSGRGKNQGTAVIQTLTPENNIIQLSKEQDYPAFYENEIIIRKAMIYPPFCDICSLLFVCENEVKSLAAARDFLEGIKRKITVEYAEQKVIILGPVPPRVSKISNKYRYRLIIKCKNNRNFRKMISELLIEYGKNKKYNDVSFIADINPESLI